MAANTTPAPAALCVDSAATPGAARVRRPSPPFDRAPCLPCAAVCRGEIRCPLSFFRRCYSVWGPELRFFLPASSAFRQSASGRARNPSQRSRHRLFLHLVAQILRPCPHFLGLEFILS